jgi:hypothetical protein
MVVSKSGGLFPFRSKRLVSYTFYPALAEEAAFFRD